MPYQTKNPHHRFRYNLGHNVNIIFLMRNIDMLWNVYFRSIGCTPRPQKQGYYYQWKALVAVLLSFTDSTVTRKDSDSVVLSSCCLGSLTAKNVLVNCRIWDGRNKARWKTEKSVNCYFKYQRQDDVRLALWVDQCGITWDLAISLTDLFSFCGPQSTS